MAPVGSLKTSKSLYRAKVEGILTPAGQGKNWHSLKAPKGQRACQFAHFGKISEMKSISKPPLPIEIYTICQNLSFDNFRKKSGEGGGLCCRGKKSERETVAIGVVKMLRASSHVPLFPLTSTQNRPINSPLPSRQQIYRMTTAPKEEKKQRDPPPRRRSSQLCRHRRRRLRTPRSSRGSCARRTPSRVSFFYRSDAAERSYFVC